MLHVLEGVKLTTAMFNCSSAKCDMLVAEMARLESLSVQTLARVAAANTPAAIQTPPPARRAGPSPAAAPSPCPAASPDATASDAERDLVIRSLTVMFDPIHGGEDVQDQHTAAPCVRFTDFAQFLREASAQFRSGATPFRNDDHLAAVLSAALRHNPDWMCAGNDNCDKITMKI